MSEIEQVIYVLGNPEKYDSRDVARAGDIKIRTMNKIKELSKDFLRAIDQKTNRF